MVHIGLESSLLTPHSQLWEEVECPPTPTQFCTTPPSLHQEHLHAPHEVGRKMYLKQKQRKNMYHEHREKHVSRPEKNTWRTTFCPTCIVYVLKNMYVVVIGSFDVILCPKLSWSLVLCTSGTRLIASNLWWKICSSLSSSHLKPSHHHNLYHYHPHHHHHQGGRTWQPFVGSKNSNENFRVKCVVFARKICKINSVKYAIDTM